MNKSAHSYIGCLILLTLIAGTTFYMNIPSLGLPGQQEFIAKEAMELSSVVVYALWVVCIVASNFISCWAHNHTENGRVTGSVVTATLKMSFRASLVSPITSWAKGNQSRLIWLLSLPETCILRPIVSLVIWVTLLPVFLILACLGLLCAAISRGKTEEKVKRKKQPKPAPPPAPPSTKGNANILILGGEDSYRHSLLESLMREFTRCAQNATMKITVHPEISTSGTQIGDLSVPYRTVELTNSTNSRKLHIYNMRESDAAHFSRFSRFRELSALNTVIFVVNTESANNCRFSDTFDSWHELMSTRYNKQLNTINGILLLQEENSRKQAENEPQTSILTQQKMHGVLSRANLLRSSSYIRILSASGQLNNSEGIKQLATSVLN